jgi:hypothetical protein
LLLLLALVPAASPLPMLSQLPLQLPAPLLLPPVLLPLVLVLKLQESVASLVMTSTPLGNQQQTQKRVQCRI